MLIDMYLVCILKACLLKVFKTKKVNKKYFKNLKYLNNFLKANIKKLFK